VGLRVFTWNVQGEVGHLINPTLELSAETELGAEGCLSLPELTYDCLRALSVIAHGFNQHGDPITVSGSELLARALQHETDHLDGVLFIDRLEPAARKAALREIRAMDWFEDAAVAIKTSPHPLLGSAR
ncbi:MAG: peptide deformylase, partial [Nocardioides sp.]